MSRTIKLFLTENHLPALSFLFFATLLAGSILVAGRLNVGSGGSDVNHVNAPSASSERRVQIVRFTLYDAGIYPHEVRANPGPLTISLEDVTGSSSGVIVHRIQDNARVLAGIASKAPNRLRSRTELNLPVGQYEVVDASRPDARALLIIEN